MIHISLEKISKRFTREWIFRDLDYTFTSGNAYAVVGPNGSGKSTLLQVISGFLPPTNGKLTYNKEGNKIEDDDIHPLLSIAAPYLELIEEFTLQEFLKFHFSFKIMMEGMSIDDIIEVMELPSAKNKLLKNFSSGMRQRVKLATCFFADSPVVLLDEPTTNLDEKGVRWYEQKVMQILPDRIVIICSNLEREYNFCKKFININDYKKFNR